MVGIDAVQRIDMQGDAAMRGQCLEEFAHQFGVECADLLGREIHVPDQEGPRRQIQRRAHLRIIHRQQEAAVTPDAALVAKRLRQRLTDGDAGILDRVVIVDMQVALGADGHVDQRMARQLVQHVIEKPDPGLIVIDPGAVEVHAHLDFGFRRLAGDFRLPHCLDLSRIPLPYTPLAPKAQSPAGALSGAEGGNPRADVT